MFFSLGHGRRMTPAAFDEHIEPVQSFAYLFPDAPETPERPDMGASLDQLAEAMAELKPEDDRPNAVLPPVFTYLGQFIDHDITVNTDGDSEASKIGDPAELLRQPRGLIVANVMNGRIGTLALDSVYGGSPTLTPASRKLQAALRDGPRLRVGSVAPVGERPTLPRDGGADLPRIGKLIEEGVISAADLPPALRPTNAEDPKNAMALIGDGRNDENLIVAQLHLAFVRFHNAVVDKILADANPAPNDDEVFRMAQRQVIWTYQWLIANEFLPAICPPVVVDSVIHDEAPLYMGLLERFREHGIDGVMPLPLEFSVAAFRYGHTMIRQSYDFNLNFGRRDFDVDTAGEATLDKLFQFTGMGAVDGSAPPFGGFDLKVLPQNWIIEWRRFVDHSPLFRDRLARPIDTELAPALFEMLKADPGIFKNLALRNLRRSYNMNLPTGQSALAALKAAKRPVPMAMNKSQLTRGRTGAALRKAGLDDETPLWFYILKEAEETQGGARLGAVGGTLVADTLFGLIIGDQDSYWHRPGSGPDGRWHPRDGVQPAGRPVVRIMRLLEAAGVFDPSAM